MRRRIGTCLLAVLMLAALTIPAFAADAPKIVNVDESKCVTTVDNADKGKLSVKVQEAKSGAQYLIYILDNETGVPTETTIKYIDQNGTGVFVPFPKDQSGKYYIFVTSSTDTRFDAKNYVATVQYQSDVLLGDVNGDGNVKPSDAALTLRIAAGLITPTEQQKIAADVNKDGNVKPSDAAMILRVAAGLLVLK